MQSDSTTSDHHTQPEGQSTTPENRAASWAWVAVDANLEEHPKVHALMDRRHWTADRAIAVLYRFWRTVRRYAANGDITGWTDAYLGRMTSSPRPGGLVADLIACGFVDDVDGRLTVHGWMERNGRWLHANATQQARVAGGRKGGATRAATGERDAAGRYRRSVGEVWSNSGLLPRGTPHSEQKQEQEQEQEPKASAASPSLRSGDLARSARLSGAPTVKSRAVTPHPADDEAAQAAKQASMDAIRQMLGESQGT